MDFEKQYTDDDYANKAGEANATGQILYVLVTDDESDGAKKKVGNLVLAEPDYYVCYEANYTDGTINENLEAEKAQKLKDIEAQEIKSRLMSLDLDAIRPLRAILSGTQTEEDLEKIKEIETKAVELRITLSTLQ